MEQNMNANEQKTNHQTGLIQKSYLPNFFCQNNIYNFPSIYNNCKLESIGYQTSMHVKDQTSLINQIKMIEKNAHIVNKKKATHQNKKMFTFEEDQKLIDAVDKLHNQRGFCWTQVSEIVGGGRTPRQCRERYKHYLDPKIKNPKWTIEEDILLKQKYEEYGPKWSIISTFFKSRTDVNIKNHWTVLNQRMQKVLNGNFKNYTISYIKSLCKLNNNKISLNDKRKVQPSFKQSHDHTTFVQSNFEINEKEQNNNSFIDFELFDFNDELDELNEFEELNDYD